MRPMRVLQVVTDTDRRGAQIFAVDLQRALAARGHDIATVAMAPGEVGGLHLPVLGPGRRRPTTLRALRRRAAGATVVVAHGSTTLFACWAALGGTGVPFVYRQISDPEFWTRRPGRRWRVRRYYRSASRTVALSEGAARVVADRFGVDPATIDVIPNGVDPAAFAPPSPEERAAARDALGGAGGPVVAYVGALVPEKGVDDLVSATRGLEGATLLVVGDGAQRAALEAAARAAAVDARFVGRRDDVREVLCAADVVVLPSRGGDSMPAVLIEAACMGLPVVATRVGSVAELVDDGVTGHLVEPGDVAGLAAALRQVAGTPAGGRLGAAGRRHVMARFDVAVVAEAWERTLERAEASGSG